MVARPGRTDEMAQTLRSLMLRIGAAPGFLGGRLFQDVDRPNVLCYLEDWNSLEALELQIRSTHYTRLLALMETAAEPPEFRLCQVAEVNGLPYLETVRFGI